MYLSSTVCFQLFKFHARVELERVESPDKGSASRDPHCDLSKTFLDREFVPFYHDKYIHTMRYISFKRVPDGEQDWTWIEKNSLRNTIVRV